MTQENKNKNKNKNLHNKTRNSYIYMLPIAGQTAEPIGLKILIFFSKFVIQFFSKGNARPFSKLHIVKDFQRSYTIMKTYHWQEQNSNN